MSEELPGFVCPQVLDYVRANRDRFVFRPRFRALTFRAPVRTPLEQLSEAHRPCPRELGPEHAGLMTMQFNTHNIMVGRTASVIDWTDPKRRLPANGLKLFRARTETSVGDQLDFTYPNHEAGPVGECFWGTGSHPAVIPGGVSLDVGASLHVHCCPRIADIEVELGFWFIEVHSAR